MDFVPAVLFVAAFWLGPRAAILDYVPALLFVFAALLIAAFWLSTRRG